MEIIKCTADDFETVKYITVTTIESVYPHYYPRGAVNYFLSHHSDKNITADIENGCVFLLRDNNVAVGTVTLKSNDVGRLFVLPEYQGKGYGRALLDFSEKTVSKNYDNISLSASFPAKSIYLKRGYKATEFNYIKTDNGDYLCYDTMVKRLK